MLRVGKFVNYKRVEKKGKTLFILKFLDSIGLQDIYLWLGESGRNSILDTILWITHSKNLDEAINKGICLAFRREWRELDSEALAFNVELRGVFDVNYQSLREARQSLPANDYKGLNLKDVFVSNDGTKIEFEKWKKDNKNHNGLKNITSGRTYTHKAYRE